MAIENAIINSEILPRTLIAYFKERYTNGMVRATKDIIADAYNDFDKDNICVLL